MYLVTTRRTHGVGGRLTEVPRAGEVELKGRVGKGRSREDRGQGDEAKKRGLPEKIPPLKRSWSKSTERGVALFEELHARLEASGAAFVGSTNPARPRVHSNHETPLATQVTPYCSDSTSDVANPLGLTLVGQEGFEPP